MSQPSLRSTNAAVVSQKELEIRNWLVKQLSQELHINHDQIRVDQAILSFGVDSVQIVSMLANLEDWAGFRFSGNPLEDYPTIEELSRYVVQLTGSSS